VTPHEKVLVAVETAPFLAVKVEAMGDGADRRLRFTTNVGDVVDAGADRPIRVETDPATGEPSPFVLVRARTICHCGRKATMVVRLGADGRPARDGAQVQIGGNETYRSLCRRHWREAVGD
jgi:hypothetical protein